MLLQRLLINRPTAVKEFRTRRNKYLNVIFKYRVSLNVQHQRAGLKSDVSSN
jgi:hypothetical protein